MEYGEKLNLIEMKDEKGFTVLSFSAYKNLEDFYMLLFNHGLECNMGSGLFKSFEEKK